MINQQDAETLSKIRATTLKAFSDAVTPGQDIAILDFPSHENVGDTMIWLGELSYAQKASHRVKYISDLFRFDADALRAWHPQGPILMHGGGNFGDIWPLFQDFRQMVAAEFHDRQVVQLPQTVYFKSADSARVANEILGAHPNYILLVRDHESLKRAQEQLPDVDVRYCPDMALGWEPRLPRRISHHRLLVLARKDREAGSGLADEFAQNLTTRDKMLDWGLTGAQRIGWSLVRIPGRLAKLCAPLRRSRLMYPLITFGYRKNAEQNARAGLGLFAGANVVVTDRLHAHVLALLLGVRHVLLDNNYGKIRAIYDDYTHAFTTVNFSSNAVDAAKQAKVLLSQEEGQLTQRQTP